MSASPVESPADATAARRVLVWDAPVRVFHWLMVASFAGAYLTAEMWYGPAHAAVKQCVLFSKRST